MANKELKRAGPKRKWVAFKHKNGLRMVYKCTDAKRTPKCVMTNVFTDGDGRGSTYIPVWDEYDFGASACDEFNKQLAGKYWPFRRMGWELGIDDFAFTAALVNILNLYRVCNNTPSLNFQTAMQTLAFDLYKHAQALSK